MSRPLPGTAALRSAILPGWGQVAAGYSRRGLAFVALTLLAVGTSAVLVLALVRPLAPLLRLPLVEPLLDRTRWLAVPEDLLLRAVTAGDWGTIWRALIGVNVVAILFRLFVILDASAGARRRLDRPAGTSLNAVASVLAMGLLILPHAAVGAAGYLIEPYVRQILVPTPRQEGAATPAPAAARVDTTSRLNVLLLGTDRRPQEATEHPWGNSDTILLVSVDPGARGAAMISLPRDLYLAIPGVGPEKINAAYREGGPNLAIKVVSDVMGVPIHRWASIDVKAFQTLIDAVGGVVVDVDRPIRDDEYPNEDYSIRRILIPAGLQWMDGERALWYARSRHSSNDFDRGLRQQRLLLALKERARDARTIQRLPQLMDALANAIQTDISPREALALSRLGSSQNIGAVRSLVLQPPVYGREIARADLYAIEPNLTRIRADVASLLSTGTSTTTSAAPPLPTIRTLPLLPVGIAGQGGGGSPMDEAPPQEDVSPND
jgi:LCP family protein required for cell wall assembly